MPVSATKNTKTITGDKKMIEPFTIKKKSNRFALLLIGVFILNGYSHVLFGVDIDYAAILAIVLIFVGFPVFIILRLQKNDEQSSNSSLHLFDSSSKECTSSPDDFPSNNYSITINVSITQNPEPESKEKI